MSRGGGFFVLLRTAETNILLPLSADCVLHANGNVYDREGFLVSEGNEFPSGELERIAATASALRTGLARMDSDITADAVPHPDTGLNKALLRIVLSGCVSTSVFVPEDMSSRFVAQIGTGPLNLVLPPYVSFSTPFLPPHNRWVTAAPSWESSSVNWASRRRRRRRRSTHPRGPRRRSCLSRRTGGLSSLWNRIMLKTCEMSNVCSRSIPFTRRHS